MTRGQFVSPSAWVIAGAVEWRYLLCGLHIDTQLVRWTLRLIFQTFSTACSADGGGGNCVIIIIIIIII